MPSCVPSRPQLAALAALAAAGAMAGSCTVTREAPDLIGQDVPLTVLHTSHLHSRLIPYSFVPDRFDRRPRVPA